MKTIQLNATTASLREISAGNAAAKDTATVIVLSAPTREFDRELNAALTGASH